MSGVLAAVSAALAFGLALADFDADQLFPFDEALFVANGLLFHTLFSDLPAFASGPVEWLNDYYAQYPALAVRRHPPLYGFLQGVTFLFSGPSLLAARVTQACSGALFLWAAGMLTWDATRSRSLALAVPLLLCSFPEVRGGISTIWLDIPAFAFGVLGLVAYARYLSSSRVLHLAMAGACLVAALYTYPLIVFLAAALGLHFLATRRKLFIASRPTAAVAAGCFVALAPLVVFQLVFATDNVASALGNTPTKWSAFQGVQEGIAAQLAVYLEVLWDHYPACIILVAIRVALSPVYKKLQAAEWICLVSAILAYTFFTWIKTESARYALYIGVPLALGASVGLGRALIDAHGRVARVGAATMAACLLVLAVAQWAWLSPPTYRLSGLGAALDHVFQASFTPRILYAGPRDAAYVAMFRMRDVHRRGHIARASVQLTVPEETSGFAAEMGANVLVFESGDAMSGRAPWSNYHDEFERLAERGRWRRYETPLTLASAGGKSVIGLVTFVRSDLVR